MNTHAESISQGKDDGMTGWRRRWGRSGAGVDRGRVEFDVDRIVVLFAILMSFLEIKLCLGYIIHECASLR